MRRLQESTTYALDAFPELTHESCGLVVVEIHERHGNGRLPQAAGNSRRNSAWVNCISSV
jgi:hypothetical protein